MRWIVDFVKGLLVEIEAEEFLKAPEVQPRVLTLEGR